VLVFPSSFWDNTDFLIREGPDWSGRWGTFLNWNKIFGDLPILVGLHVADTAQSLEGLDDATIVGEAMQVRGGEAMQAGSSHAGAGGKALLVRKPCRWGWGTPCWR
jgi:hypothetical protein